MIALEAGGLRAEVDPAHGAEALVLAGPDGVNVLGRTPAPGPPVPGDLELEPWHEQYRGGWQLCAPNVGAAGERDGVRHGFHGRASNDHWDLAARGPDWAELTWAGHGLQLARRLVLAADGLRATTTVRAVHRAPCLALEHVTFAPSALGLPARLELPAGERRPAGSEPDELATPLADVTWIVDADPRRCRVVGRERTVSVHWGGWPRHLWIWRELHTTEPFFGGRGEMLGVEVGTLAHGDGIAGELPPDAWLEPGEERTLDVRVALEGAS